MGGEIEEFILGEVVVCVNGSFIYFSFLDCFWIQLTVDMTNCLSVVYIIVFDIIQLESAFDTWDGGNINMDIKICENIKRLRRQLGITQEMLADYCGISSQAVSKWEMQQSVPDVSVLPAIAEYFKVSMDELFFGDGGFTPLNTASIPNNDEVYIVQVLNGIILGIDEWHADKQINLEISREQKVSLNVWGNAIVTGSVSGGIIAGSSVKCGNVSGGINTGSNVECGNVSGGLCAGSVECGNVSGGLCAKDIQCKDVSGDIKCDGTIHCSRINQVDHIKCEVLYCKGELNCDSINGEVHVES